MDLSIEKIEKGERIAPENISQYYKDEITRVETALEDARKRMMDLEQSLVLTGEKANKISELNYAIAVGKMYLRKLKNKR